MFDKIKVYIGLGNPEERYALTYHNVGQLFLDSLGEELAWEEKNDSFLVAHLKSGSKKIILMKPLSYMNLSGQNLKKTLSQLKIKPEECLFVHDDADLSLGTFKFSFNRGSAGHRGVHSVIQELGSAHFWRLRIGIRSAPGKAGDFVLKKIGPQQKTLLYEAFATAKEKLMTKE